MLYAEAMDIMLNAANLVTLARTAVERDHRGDVVYAHASEMPTRFARCSARSRAARSARHYP